MSVSPTSSDSFNLQDRDLEILRGLFESRLMTAVHIAALYFAGSRDAAKKRLQKLKATGLISEKRRKANEPAILFLTRDGFALLNRHGALAEYPSIGQGALERRANVSEFTLRHELEIMDVKAAICSAMAGASAFHIAEFSTWPLLYQFEVSHRRHGGTILVKPDGFIRIHENEPDGGLYEHAFFLEVDRSTEAQNTLVSRASSYLDYYRSGGFADRCGASRQAYKEYPFRVLMVFKTAERRNNTAEGLLRGNPPIYTQACLSTLEEVVRNPLGAIWVCPRDYQMVTRGTPYDVERRRGAWGYRREPSREAFIETRVQKFSLFGETEVDVGHT